VDPYIRLEQITHRFPNGTTALSGINLQIDACRFTVMIGDFPSAHHQCIKGTDVLELSSRPGW